MERSQNNGKWTHLLKFSFTHLVLQSLFWVLLGTYFAQCFSVFIIEFGQVNTGWKGYVKWKIYVIFLFNFLVPLFRPSLFRVVLFFYISIYQVYDALPWNDLKKHTIGKTNFEDEKKYNQKQHFEWQIKTNNLKFISTDILVSFLRPFSKYENCICLIYNVR